MFEVREAAVRVVLELYQRHPASVLEYLPAEDSSARRSVLYKTLFEGFARVDGRPTDSELRVSDIPRATPLLCRRRKPSPPPRSVLLEGRHRCTELGQASGSFLSLRSWHRPRELRGLLPGSVRPLQPCASLVPASDIVSFRREL